MIIRKYEKIFKNEWNNFVNKAKNGHFFFNRDFMEYHSNKFQDFSLIIFDDNDKILSILPANIKENTLYSHQGLTFGGFVTNERTNVASMLGFFKLLKIYLHSNNISRMVYKAIPYIYHSMPAEEDRYALFVYNAKLIKKEVSSTILLQRQIGYTKGRKWTVNKAKKENLKVEKSLDFKNFWVVLEDVLRFRHNASPVHTIDEIERLATLFPENIKLYIIKIDEEIIAGTIIFENANIVHTQYMANSDYGKKIGALDLLIDYLIKDVYKNKIYFDFGISTEEDGKILNKGLIEQKEGFGARAVVHDCYELNL
jgi:hypothetical protein